MSSRKLSLLTRKRSNDSPNMRTRAWGQPLWFGLTCIAMGYPATNPSPKQRKCYKTFFTALGDVLPCNLCRDSYKKFIKECRLDAQTLNSRRNLVMWLFRIHNKVNKKLGCKVLNKQQLERKYNYFNQFRAQKCNAELGGCVTAHKSVRSPKGTKVVTYKDLKALRK